MEASPVVEADVHVVLHHVAQGNRAAAEAVLHIAWVAGKVAAAVRQDTYSVADGVGEASIRVWGQVDTLAAEPGTVCLVVLEVSLPEHVVHSTLALENELLTACWALTP